MNVALRPGPVAHPAGGEPTLVPPQIARVETFTDMRAAEPHWRDLMHSNALATAYQRFEFLYEWHRHVGAPDGVEPFIVIAFDRAGTPLCLFPFGRRRVGSLRVLEFLGGKHVNFNLAVWRRDALAAITEETLGRMLSGLDADALVLTNQPILWNGTGNPFALLPHQASANSGFSGALIPDFETLLRSRTNSEGRKKLRKKERGLAALGEVSFSRAIDAAETSWILDAFFVQKHARMRAAGLTDAFADESVRQFIEAIAQTQLPGGAPLLELYALKLNDQIVATFSGMVHGGRFCGMFNSLAEGEVAWHSPGEQLLIHLVRDCCDRGLTTFDLGTGSARYKAMFCPDEEPLFDSYLPLSGKGKLYVAIARRLAAVKRAIKTSSPLWSLVCKARKLRARLG
jgi:CelD/BcsL family acetyltransferase involved in cellulose biosynthesis